jgi:multiple sugar transport system ATP-binding protein
MAAVALRGVHKSFGSTRVLHNVDITIADGEFCVLVGPSGCGKSTLLRMIAGLENVTGGDIEIGGRVVNHVHPKERDIAMVFQNYALYPHMTVRENMGFSLRLRNEDKSATDKRVNDAAQILNLEPYLDRYPRQLSGGQRQRVAMGRAIVRDPAVFLFDEPLSNLDAKLRVQMRTEIKALHQRLSTTTVYVTHDQIEAMTMADRIVILKDGRIEQIGGPLAVYDNPANLFVAEFIGSPGINLMHGEVAAENGAPVVRSGSIALPLSPKAAVSPGQKVVYGIRPEHLRPSSNNSGLGAKVIVVEPTGAEIHIYADLAGKEVCAVTQDRLQLDPGDEVRLVPLLDRVHLFDQATGKALAA